LAGNAELTLTGLRAVVWWSGRLGESIIGKAESSHLRLA
jgi:hypothetical protein